MPPSSSFDVSRPQTHATGVPVHPSEQHPAAMHQQGGTSPYLPSPDVALRRLPDIPASNSPLLSSPRFFSAESLPRTSSHDTLLALRSPGTSVNPMPRSPIPPSGPAQRQAPERAPIGRSPAPSDSSFSRRRFKHWFQAIKETLTPPALLRIDSAQKQHSPPPSPPRRGWGSLKRPLTPYGQPLLSKSQGSLMQSSPPPVKSILRSPTLPKSPTSPRKPAPTDYAPSQRPQTLKERRSNKSLRLGRKSEDGHSDDVALPLPRRRTSSLAQEGEIRRPIKGELPPVPQVPSMYLGIEHELPSVASSSAEDLTPRASQFPSPPTRHLAISRPSRQLQHRAPPTPPPLIALPALPLVITTADELKRLSSSASHKSEPSVASTLGLSTASSATTPPSIDSPPLRPMRTMNSNDQLAEALRLVEIESTPDEFDHHLEHLLELHQKQRARAAAQPKVQERVRQVPWYEIGRVRNGQYVYLFGSRKIWRDAAVLAPLWPKIQPLCHRLDPPGEEPQLSVELTESDLMWLAEHVSHGEAGEYRFEPGETPESRSRSKIKQLKRLRVATEKCGDSLSKAKAIIHEELLSECEKIYENALDPVRNGIKPKEIATPLRTKVNNTLRLSSNKDPSDTSQPPIYITHNFDLPEMSPTDLDTIGTRKIDLLEYRGPVAFLPAPANLWLDAAKKGIDALNKWLHAADIALLDCKVEMQRRKPTMLLSICISLPYDSPQTAARSLQRVNSLRRQEHGHVFHSFS